MQYDPDTCDPFAHSVRAEIAERVRIALLYLPGRDGDVLRIRFGLSGGGEFTYDEIGLIFGISGYRVSQLAQRGLSRLRKIDDFPDLFELWDD